MGRRSSTHSQTGIQLIDTIQNELLKSAELTGQWEKRLKEIEQGNFNAATFIQNMKKMVENLVYEVRSEKERANISHNNTSSKETITTSKIKSTKNNSISAEKCPKCKKGTILKGSTAYGCSEYKNGCDFIMPFNFLKKNISENQFVRLLKKGSTVNLKGFKREHIEVEGLVSFDENYKLKLEENSPASHNNQASAVQSYSTHISEKISCPKCKKGTVLKGKSAYGCSEYKNGCDFIFSFDNIRKLAGNQKLSKELVLNILNGN
jgi:DNA topoisomerase-3